MAGRKKGRGSAAGKKKSSRKTRRDARPNLPPLGGLAMDAMWRQMMPDLGTADSPLEQAQDIIFQAFEAEPDGQVALAQRALAICADCADAYVLLGIHAETVDEAIALFTEGVAAGERALGKKTFQEDAGVFWGLVETRPYMRARLELAQALWAVRRGEEAVGHYREMLRLNPNDNQGVRYLLAAALLEMDCDDDLRKLLKRYEDEASAEWAYSAALLAFRTGGDSAEAKRLLATAQKVNRYVPAYLLGVQQMPQQMPDYISPGEESEAVSYAANFLAGWKGTSGAITWLRSNSRVNSPQSKRKRPPLWQDVRDEFAALPQADETWQVDVCQSKIEPSAHSAAPWSTLIVDAASGAILCVDLADKRPSNADLWEVLLRTMVWPEEGESRRPKSIELRLKALVTPWGNKLREIDVECWHSTELARLDEALEIAERSADLAGTAAANRKVTISLDELAALPQQAGEVWQADFRQVASWMQTDQGLQRPWVMFVTNRDEGSILTQDVWNEPVELQALWQQVSVAMARPQIGEPHRPGVIQVNSEDKRAALAAHLKSLGIECVACEALDHIDFMVDELTRHMAGPNAMPAQVDQPGVTAEQVGTFYSAAEEFYRGSPWRKIPGDTPIQITCNKFEPSTWYAVVMGQSGISMGMVLYDDLPMLERLLGGQYEEGEIARLSSAISLNFCEAFEISPGDLAAAERHGWPVAGPEAYPHAVRVSPGFNVRPLLAWELELLVVVLRTLPDFSHGMDEPEEFTVPLASGPVAIELELMG